MNANGKNHLDVLIISESHAMLCHTPSVMVASCKIGLQGVAHIRTDTAYNILLHLIHIHKLMVTIHWSIPTYMNKNKFSYFKK